MEASSIPESDHKTEVFQVAKGASYLLLGSLIGYVVRFGKNILVSRTIGVDAYGVYSLGMNLVMILSRVAMLGLHVGIVRYVALYNGENDRARVRGALQDSLGLSGLFAIILGIGCSIASPLISERMYAMPELTPVLRVLALSIPGYAITFMALRGAQGFRRMGYTATINNIFIPLARLVLSILFLLLGWHLIGVSWAYVIPFAITVIWSLGLLNRIFPIIGKNLEVSHIVGPLLRFSAPLFLFSISQILGSRSEVIILGWFLDAREIGIFNAAFTTVLTTELFLTAFSGIFSPIVSDLHNQQQFDRLSSMFKLITRWGLMTSFPLFVLMLVFPQEMMSLYGKGFPEGASVVVLLALSQIVHVATGAVGTMLSMSGRPTLTLILSIFRMALALALDIWLIPRYGLWGAALASSIALIIAETLRVLVVFFTLKMHPFSWSVLKPIVAAVITFGFAVGTKFLAGDSLSTVLLLLLGGSIICAIYVPLLLLFRLEDDDQFVINILRKRVRKVLHIK